MTDFNVMLDVIVIVCGFYLIYSAIKVMKTGQLEGSALMGKTIELRRTSDKEGYIKYICPKAIVFGVLVIICGICQVIMEKIQGYYYVKIAAYGIFSMALIIFCVIIYKGQNKYLIEPTKKKKKTEENEDKVS